MGSSPSTQAGRVTSARATAARWRSPPDSSPGLWPRRCAQPDALQQCLCRRRAQRPPSRRDQQRHHHVFERGEFRQQVVELVDETQRAVAQLAALRHRSAPTSAGRRHRPRRSSAESRPPSRCSSVLLPAPEAPTMATVSPAHHRQLEAVEHRRAQVAFAIGLAEVAARITACSDDAGLDFIGSLITQRRRRIGARGAPGRIQGGQQAQDEGQAGDHRDVAGRRSPSARR